MRQAFYFAKRWYWTSVTVSAVGPGAIAASIQYIATGGVTGWWPVAAAVLGGLMTAGALRLIGEHEPTNQPRVVPLPPLQADQPIAQPSLPPAPFVQGKVFSPRTPDELVNEVKGLTDIRRQHAIQLHLGQWLHVAGRIRNVEQMAPDDEITVSVDLTESGVTVFMDFAPSYWQARLQAANINDTISSIGKIKDVRSYGGNGFVSLDECELLDLNGNLPTS